MGQAHDASRDRSNRRSFLPGRVVFGLGTGVVLWVAGNGMGQSCAIDEYEQVRPQGLGSSDQYGSAVEASGDWVFVGAPFHDAGGTDAGAVFVFEVAGKGLIFRQRLLPVGGVGAGQFGSAISADGDWLFIGAPLDGENDNAGAAYAFHFDGSAWVQQTKFSSMDEFVTGARFGTSIDVVGELAVIGAPQSVYPGIGAVGTVHVFRLDGKEWFNEQVLRANQPHAGDAFGASVAIASGMILAGAPKNDTQFNNAGSVFAFFHDGWSWVAQAQLQPAFPSSGDEFGTRMASEGLTVVIGTPQPVGGSNPPGAAYTIDWNGQRWVFGTRLVGPQAATGDRFGAAVAIRDGTILVGAPYRNVFVVDISSGLNFHPDAGEAYEFKRIGGEWLIQRIQHLRQPLGPLQASPYECWGETPAPTGSAPSIDNARMGNSVAITSIGKLAGCVSARPICQGQANPIEAGGMNFFWTGVVDCNVNGVPDHCEFWWDCNRNGVPDECEIGETSTDCNGNGVPDDCDAGMPYELTNGLAAAFWYLVPPVSRDQFWLNQYRVKAGGQVVTQISFCTSRWVPPNLRARVLVYDDPNNDGNPIDAVLLATAETTATFNLESEQPMTLVQIPPTFVGNPGEVFFVGVLIEVPASVQWSLLATASPLNPAISRSWLGSSEPMGSADIYDLGDNLHPPALWLQPNAGPFVLHAMGNDCNSNGIPDMCDIESGSSADKNGNAVPDECDVLLCVADVFPAGPPYSPGDGQVNVNDLLAVINQWGVCSPCYAYCDGDTNDDCKVNVSDLLAVIAAWGPCP